MVRLKLSKYWWSNLYLFLVLGIGITIALIWFHLHFVVNTDNIPWWALPALSGLMLLGCLDAALKPWRFLMTMEVYEDVFRSYLFGKLKCEVFTNQEVYYAIFDCKESLHTTKKYIAISNAFFVCKKRKPSFFSENRFIDYYDRTKQIIFPYNETTQRLFPVETWICVNKRMGNNIS